MSCEINQRNGRYLPDQRRIRMKKKLVALALTAVMSMSLAACGGTAAAPAASAPAAAPAAEEKTEEAAAPAESEASTEESASASSDGVFKIGVYNWLAGVPTDVEQPIAFQVALNKYNNEVNGEKVEFVVYDTQNNPTEAVAGVQKLIGENCDAVIGSFQSADTVAAYPFLENAHIVNILPCTSGSLVTPDQVYSFRGSFNANMTADTYAKVAVENFGYTNCCIFYGQDEASVSNFEVVKPTFEAAGLEILDIETGTSTDTDYSSQCMKITAADPDFVYVVCQSAGQNFIKQLREYGYNGIIMSKDEWMTAHVDAVGEEFSNFIMSEVAYTTYKSIEEAKESGASDNVIEFLEAYQEVSGGSLPTIGITYRLYDSLLILLEGAKRAGTNHDSDAIAEAILGINDLEGCMGTIDFTQGDREPAHSFTGIIYYNGGSKPLDAWFTNGGYDDFKERTGREK